MTDLQRLDAYRIEHDWTWKQLAEAMGRAGVPMSPRTLHYLIKRLPTDAKPLDRTLYKIGKFVAHLRSLEGRRKTDKAARDRRAAAPSSTPVAGSL